MIAPKKSATRGQQFIDWHVQGAIIVRSVVYWLLCLVTVVAMLLIWRIFTGPARPFYTQFDELWQQFGPALLASFVLLPIVVLDSVRMSNRFAGPVLRIRRAMQELADGKPVAPVEFRGNDYWPDLASNFNAMLQRIELRERDVKNAARMEQQFHEQALSAPR